MLKKINPELRARAVRMVQEHQQDYPSQTAAAQAVARQLGLGRETVRRWVVSAEIDAGGRPGATSAELAEIKTLKAKVRRLEEDNAILRSATVFFASMPSLVTPGRGSLISSLPQRFVGGLSSVVRLRPGVLELTGRWLDRSLPRIQVIR